MDTKWSRVLGGVIVLALLGACVLPASAQWLVGSMRSVTIDYNTSGDKTLVAAVAAKAIHVYQFEIYCSGANNITLKDSAATVLAPTINFAAGQGVIRDYNSGLAWYTTGVGAGLVLNLSASQQCSGIVFYTQGG